MKIFNTPYDSFPFSKYKEEDYKEAIEKQIAIAREEINQIVNQKEPPSFENTIEKLVYSGMELGRVSSAFYNLHSAETTPILEKQAAKIMPMLSQFSNEILLNEALFDRIKYVYEHYQPKTTEEKTLLEKTYKNFVRNGALLSPQDKEMLRQIDKELSVLTLQFSQNVLQQTQQYQLVVSDEKQLSGLPDYAKQAAKELAQSQGKEGFIFTLQTPSLVPFLTYCEDRSLREKLYKTNAKRAYHSPENDNSKIVGQIVALRQRRASLLGYKNYSDFVLEERMAQSGENVIRFLNELAQKATEKASQELEELKKLAQERDSVTDFQKWDTAFYAEKLKQQKMALDDAKLKPYFPLEQVLQGVFKVSERLYGLRFTPIYNVEVYHKEVQTYLVTDEQGKEVALLYTDFHPRKGKRNGAWMTSFKPQYKLGGADSRPHISIVCNFSRPTESLPSLLSFNEVTTLFHEFGHALHGMLADTIYPNLSGTQVLWDFVELPSQIMENWCFEPEALSLFAKHYQTQEPLPAEYITRMKQLLTFMEGLQTLRQIGFGLLDMAWHSHKFQTGEKDIESFENEVMAGVDLYPKIPNTSVSTAFSHIFSGGYAAGYYSYKWAEVLDADAFELFSQTGIFNKETAQRFKKNILSKGGTVPPMDLFKQFRGRAPRTEALLRRAGLMAEPSE